MYMKGARHDLALADEAFAVDPVFEDAIDSGVRQQIAGAELQENAAAGVLGANRVSSIEVGGRHTSLALQLLEQRRQFRMAHLQARQSILQPLGQIGSSNQQAALQGALAWQQMKMESRSRLYGAIIGGVAGAAQAAI